ncbi:unnamed protein product [Peronospora belbahrii]|uniref:Haloacid dehalogenase-like hydrolase n=1 Tax=Peronospora belbahrii TaxID=622444 RepID=A0AAU9L6D2_9STRA|nr:unnamed protein product [Peronospora belbahrii]CAH0513634.1 unnamed protein product [Peronospora belbahrii]
MSSRHAWRYVTFDATGTLLRPAECLGKTYLNFWKAASGQSLSSSRYAAAVAALTSQFPTEFSLLSRSNPNFGSDSKTTSAFLWWRQLVLNVMKRAKVVDCLAHNEEQVERFMRNLYAHFARPEAWMVFEDVKPTLERLVAMKVPIGVISNFDERLESLLVGLKLRDYFQVVTTSFGQPQMKPHASIFQSTFKQLQTEEEPVVASKFLHVGDHLSRDFKAAKDIGAQARLLWRTKHPPPPNDINANEVIATLHDVVAEKQVNEVEALLTAW